VNRSSPTPAAIATPTQAQTPVPALALVLAAFLTTRPAAGLDIHPHVIASAGGTATSPRFSILGTAGQPLASSPAPTPSPFAARSGFWAQVLRWKNSPPNPANDFITRRPGDAAHVLVRTLLQNDHDADFDPLTLVRFDTTTALGGSVYRDGPWLVYQPPANTTPSTVDTFTYEVTDGDAPSPTATVTIGPFIPSPTGGPPNALAIQLDPGPPARIHLRFQGIALRSYLVQSSLDPAGPWNTLATVTAAANGAVHHTDTPSDDPRFYRLAEP
jgi:hypothetical protein